MVFPGLLALFGSSYNGRKYTAEMYFSDGSSHSSLYGQGNGIDDDRACAEILSEDVDTETNQQDIVGVFGMNIQVKAPAGVDCIASPLGV
ncbi:hypothetical protein ZIOFF_032651 [Zingiber officinale]|uniref:Uncharacterized protein n=1 Tax=Zingiber officinale TaxID=94328 RepID=A0A8J5GVR5_ZINOF|nr:hypothetical protein ZIOFF_032651 [Zingiber officinale]